MEGSCKSFAGEIVVCSGDLESYWSLSVDGVFLLAGEVGEGSTIVGSLFVKMPIFGSPIPSSCSPTSKTFLALSL
jgi:hypothetical protein